MLKQTRASYFSNFKNAQYCALSGDPIPDYIKNGDEVYIIDTAKRCLYDADSGTLIEQPSSGGGGSSDWVNASVTFINNTPENGEYFIDTPFGVIPIEEQETIVLPLKKEDDSIFYLSLKDVIDIESSVAPSVTGDITIEENGFEIQGDGSIAFSSLAPTEISGVPPLELEDALARPLRKLVQHGKVDVSGTDVVCNNGTLKVVNGEIVADGTPEEIRLAGVNQWDEEWEVGNIDSSTGKNVSGDDRIRSVNYIPVLPSTNYYFVNGSGKTYSLRYYDADKNYINNSAGTTSPAVYQTPNNCYFVRFIVVDTTYNDNISINYPSTDHDYHKSNVQTATAENLFAVGDIEDTQDIISGTVTHRTEAVVSDGTTPTGRYVGTVGEGNIIVKAREDGYTGDIVSFETEEETPLNGLIVSLEPQQDLHGYDAPWPAGGGKNKFDGASVSVLNNLSVTNGVYSNTRADTRDKFNFTVQAYNGSTQVGASQVLTISEAGRYSVTINITSEPTQLRIKHNGSSVDFVIQYPFNKAGTFTVSISVLSADPVTVGGLSFNNVMVEEGSTASAFAPYENICPITGYTGVDAWRTGKNLFDQSSAPTIMDCYADGGSVTTRRAYKIELPSGTYTFSATKKPDISTGAFIYLNRVNKDGSFASFHYLITGSATSATITLSLADGQYFLLYDAQASLPSSENKFDYFDFQLELGSTASAYEEYHGNQVSVTFPDEVFGVTPDIVSGEMPVTWKKVVLDGTEAGWAANFNAQYPGRNYVYNRNSVLGDLLTAQRVISSYVKSDRFAGNDTIIGIYVEAGYLWVRSPVMKDMTDIWDWKNYLGQNPLEVAYLVETPIPTEITPTPISTLEGDNNIWSNAGPVAVYVPTGDVVERVTPQKLSTAEGDNTLIVTAEVDDIVFDVAYRKDNSGEETLPDARGVYF